MADALIPLAVKLLWDESLPLRKFVYSRLPFAKDAAKRKLAEVELGKLLEDSHKLARALPPDQADEAIDRRIEVFRMDLIRGHIPADQVETIVSRGDMFVRMLVTEPIMESASLKMRVIALEKMAEDLEAQVESQAKVLAQLQNQIAKPPRDPQIMALWVGFGVALILEAVQLFHALAGGVSH